MELYLSRIALRIPFLSEMGNILGLIEISSKVSSNLIKSFEISLAENSVYKY